MQYAKPVTLNVEECDRLSFLPYLFGNDFLYAEAYVYALAQMYPSLQTIYDFLWLIGEAIFFYLPVGICWSAVKKMGGTPILGIVLGVTLVSPQLMNAYLLGQQLPEVWDFGMLDRKSVV